MSRIHLDETQQNAYHDNLIAALDAVYEAVEERRYDGDDETFHDILHTHPPGIDDDVLTVFRAYANEEHGYDLRELTDQWTGEGSDTVFLDGIQDQIDAVSEEYDQLLSHYQTVEISEETGLPVYSPSVVHDFREDYAAAISSLRRDTRNTREQMQEVQDALTAYVEGQDWQDDIDLASDDAEDVETLFETVTDDIVEVARQDILRGNLPEESWKQLERVEQLEELEEFDPFERGRTDNTVLDTYEDSVFFRIDMMDYSDAKDSSPLFYGVAGQQQDTRSLLSRFSLKDLPIREEADGYSLSPDVSSVMESVFDLPPESGLALLDNLEERDVTYGDTMHPTVIEMARIGPFYFDGMELPPTADEALEKATTVSPDLIQRVDGDPEDFRYDSLEEMAETDPAAYTAVQIRNVIEDNPDAYVLTAERYRASHGLSDQDMFWQDRELFLAAPDGIDLSTYLPDDTATDTGSFSTTTIPVDDLEPFDTDTYTAAQDSVSRVDTAASTEPDDPDEKRWME